MTDVPESFAQFGDQEGHIMWEQHKQIRRLEEENKQLNNVLLTLKKAQAEIAKLEAENERLRGVINRHNVATQESCDWMQKHRGCDDYTMRGKKCPDCPKDWEIEY